MVLNGALFPVANAPAPGAFESRALTGRTGVQRACMILFVTAKLWAEL